MLWKKVRESLSRLSINEFKLATNNMLGYDMPRVKLKKTDIPPLAIPAVCIARYANALVKTRQNHTRI